MRITNPEDQAAVASSSERLGQTLLDDLPGLDKGEAVIVGEMTRAPIMAKIRKRTTREGGSDIDVVSKMKNAVDKARAETVENESERLRKEIEGFMGSTQEKR
jgi:hypothetical protein